MGLVRARRAGTGVGWHTPASSHGLNTMNKLARGFAPALVLCLPLGVLAQSASRQPDDAGTAAPPLRYQSAFADYTPWQDVRPGDWRQLNDALAASPAAPHGGHAGHAMPAPSVPPASTPHGGHSRHGGPSRHGGHSPHGGKP